jgi:hypothetical protein
MDAPSRRTHVVVLEQEALRLFLREATQVLLSDMEAGRSEDTWERRKADLLAVDIFDALLIGHVVTRLTRRTKQRAIVEAGTPLVWCHLGTIPRENWFCGLSVSSISHRVCRLVRLGILTRKQVQRGRKGSQTYLGSQSFLGLSEAYRRCLESLDRPRPETPLAEPQTFETPLAEPRFETLLAEPRSLGVITLGEKSVTLGAPSHGSGASMPNPTLSDEEREEEGEEETA